MKYRRTTLCLAGTAFALAVALPAAAATLSPDVQIMVEEAIRSGDTAKADAVISVAKSVYPQNAAEIDAIAASVNQEMANAHRQKLKNGGLFNNWSGSGELGASIASGNSDTVTLAAGLRLERDGIDWRHLFLASADYQRDDGKASQERYRAQYQLDHNLTDRFYLVGTLGWERNAVSGLRSRLTESLGAGYKVINQPNAVWRLESGVAFRQAKFRDRRDNRTAYRGVSDFTWTFAPATTLTQNTAVFLESGSSSMLSTTALTAGISGALSARLSFDVQYESDPPAGDKKTDTVSRATLVYGF